MKKKQSQNPVNFHLCRPDRTGPSVLHTFSSAFDSEGSDEAAPWFSFPSSFFSGCRFFP